jgi:hypothetical protein
MSKIKRNRERERQLSDKERTSIEPMTCSLRTTRRERKKMSKRR